MPHFFTWLLTSPVRYKQNRPIYSSCQQFGALKRGKSGYKCTRNIAYNAIHWVSAAAPYSAATLSTLIFNLVWHHLASVLKQVHDLIEMIVVQMLPTPLSVNLFVCPPLFLVFFLIVLIVVVNSKSISH
jgi:hypothetical protein